MALRRSWPARITALGFVVVIVFGNFAIADIVMGVDIAAWTFNGMWIGIAVTILGGLALVGLALARRLRPRTDDVTDTPEDVTGTPGAEG